MNLEKLVKFDQNYFQSKLEEKKKKIKNFIKKTFQDWQKNNFFQSNQGWSDDNHGEKHHWSMFQAKNSKKIKKRYENNKLMCIWLFLKDQ
jgi:hypothetical protein